MLRENRLWWFGHVSYRIEDALFRAVEGLDIGDLRRRRRKQKITWMEGVRYNMKKLGLHEPLILDRR